MVKFHEKRSVQLNLANKLWIHKEYGVKETFESILKKCFQVTVDKVNFKTYRANQITNQQMGSTENPAKDTKFTKPGQSKQFNATGVSQCYLF